MSRRPLIAGNWKMYLSAEEATKLAVAIAQCSHDVNDRDVMLAPPYVHLQAVSEAVKGTEVKVAAQNVCWEEEGAFTGEISPVMLQASGVSMVILGHSERRHVFGESDELVNKRLHGAIRFGLIPILCIGEKLEEREQGRTYEVLKYQLEKGLSDVTQEDAAKIVIAYEPVWAIGTGQTATREQAQDAHFYIRGVLAELFEKKLADSLRILYGGSVKPDNVDSLMAEPDIDGALVGGAALKSESFDRIIHFQR